MLKKTQHGVVSVVLKIKGGAPPDLYRLRVGKGVPLQKETDFY
jgi:hypothetical protein